VDEATSSWSKFWYKFLYKCISPRICRHCHNFVVIPIVQFWLQACLSYLRGSNYIFVLYQFWVKSQSNNSVWIFMFLKRKNFVQSISYNFWSNYKCLIKQLVWDSSYKFDSEWDNCFNGTEDYCRLHNCPMTWTW